MGINEERAGELFDLLADGDMTSDVILDETGWSKGQFQKANQVLRDMLADDGDTITSICEPMGKGESWLYGLRAGNQILSSEESSWIPNRLGDAERRLVTIRHVLDVAVRVLDSRTILGRKARIYQLHLKRAEEEVAMLNSDGDAEG